MKRLLFLFNTSKFYSVLKYTLSRPKSSKLEFFGWVFLPFLASYVPQVLLANALKVPPYWVALIAFGFLVLISFLVGFISHWIKYVENNYQIAIDNAINANPKIKALDIQLAEYKNKIEALKKESKPIISEKEREIKNITRLVKRQLNDVINSRSAMRL